MLVEGSWQLNIEGRRNVSQVEIHPVPPRRRVDAVEIADTLALDERRYRPTGDGEGLPLRLCPIRIKTGIPDYKNPPFPRHVSFLRHSGEVQRRRIYEYLRARPPVDVHLLVGFP